MQLGFSLASQYKQAVCNRSGIDVPICVPLLHYEEGPTMPVPVGILPCSLPGTFRGLLVRVYFQQFTSS